MSRQKFTVVAAIIGAVITFMFVSYLVPTSKQVTMLPSTLEEQEKYDALGVAQRFIPTSPTFAFDGDINSLKTEYVGTTKSLPPQHIIRAEFVSSHGGFGNREGQVLTQVITGHKMTILVSEGRIISAVTDDAWDDLNDQFVLKSQQ